ncbi:MAG: FtsX-like permease family protein [Synechococcaceae cyanobacterium RL_1_2]|nr:FtsX-like permease family protein [Synechococcaceae cyanobacterium RL_1_2]
MVSLARKNLLEDIPRFLVAQAGIMFAVSLVTIQTGILKGFSQSTILLIENSPADIWIASEKMVNFELTQPLIAEQLKQVESVAGVAIAEPLMLGNATFYPNQGQISPIKIIGFKPGSTLFKPGELVRGEMANLDRPYNMMVDQTKLESLGMEKLGDLARIQSLPVQLVAVNKNSQSIASSTFGFTSLNNANTYINANFSSTIDCSLDQNNQLLCASNFDRIEVPHNSLAQAMPIKPLEGGDPISYILVKIDPEMDLTTVQQNLERTMPGIRAYSRQAMADKTKNYWVLRTGIGFILGLGAGVGVIVGIVVVSQILYSSVSDHLQEFATLKAMGAPNRTIYAVIMEQALWMALLGFLPGIGLCWGVSVWAGANGVIILITPVSAIAVLGITVVMCLSSSFFAIQKVMNIDPAVVFKA